MATVYSRPLKSGGVRWYTKVPKPGGGWTPVPLISARNETQAERLAYEIEKQHERTRHGLDGGAVFAGTFGELCEWAWSVHFKNLRGTQSDKSRLECHGGAKIPDDKPKSKRGAKRSGGESPLGRTPARTITRHVLENYFDTLASKPTVRGTPMSNNAINRIRATFSIVFELAKSRGKWFGDNPAELTGARAIRRIEPSILTLEEIPRVLDATPDHWRGVFAVGLLAGLRKGEIFGLMKSDVDLAKRRINVRRSHGHDRTKGGDGLPEAVPIHDALMPFIEAALQSPGAYLFPGHDGKRRPEKTKPERILRAALVRAGIVEHYDHKCRRKGCKRVEQHADDAPRDCPKCEFRLWPVGVPRHIVFHGTRHTMASNALMAGASIAAVQKILRHKDPRLTLRTYGHLAPDYLESELNRMTIPGLSGGDEPEPTGATPSKDGEQAAPSRIKSTRRAGSRGASMVRGASGDVGGSVVELRTRGKHAGLTVEPTGIEPVTYALRKPRGSAPQTVTAYQAGGSAALSAGGDSTAFHGSAPVFSGRGASMVRGASRAHHSAAERIARGSRPEASEQPAHVLTVKQVAARLQVSTAVVYRLAETGALGHVRIGNVIRVTEADLAAFLARAATGRPQPKGGR
jgi:excisionase family DNA binding protein